jgi:DnaK suppressor protein
LYQLSTGERDILRRIDAALDRMESGSYGACVHCAKKVQIGRLEAVPWARHCIECQELQDRGEI